MAKTLWFLHLAGPEAPVPAPRLSPFLIIQVLAILGTGFAIKRTGLRRFGPFRMLIMIWPLSYAATHISYDIWIYYPRHVVAFNLALLASTAWLISLAPASRRQQRFCKLTS